MIDKENASLLFSVVVPTRRRPRGLCRCLRALSESDYPRERFEIVVVDDDGALEAASLASIDESIRLLRCDNRGPAAARNAGADVARGRFLAFVDDDCVPAADWLGALERRLLEDPRRMVGGRTVNGLEANRCSSASQLIVDMVYRHFNADPERATFLSSGNLALASSGFREIGGFDESLRVSEDRELCSRWRERGHPMVYEPRARVTHFNPQSFGGFVRRHFGRGRGAWRYRRVRVARGRWRHDHGFHRDLPNLLLSPFRRTPARRAVPLATLLVIWQVAQAAGYAWEAGRERLVRGARR